jgi:hypothetical protein
MEETPMELTLCYAPMACSLVAYVNLTEAGATFSVRTVNTGTKEQKSAEYLAVNPKGKVPVLVVDGYPLTENVAIQQFIARSFPAAKLLPAYDDALGVTAAFNRNLLVHLNREYGANFGLDAFTHEVRWDAAARRIEMHLKATRACEVSIPALELSLRFHAGETVWTESSHRFNVDELQAWGHEADFTAAASWVDSAWPLALTLFVAR